MSEVVELLPEFPGFAVSYDPSKNPFFKSIMIENLRKVASVPVGKTLFKLIDEARPLFCGDFPPSVNVMCVPKMVKYMESGYAPSAGNTIFKVPEGKGSEKYDAPKGCRQYIIGSSANSAKEPPFSTNGKGSVCTMAFTNAQMITSKGDMTRPYLVLAHELVHSYHCLYGIKKQEGEELWATGIGQYADEPICENVFRDQFKVGRRLEYYA